MILLTHIIIAISSMALTTALAIWPSSAKLRASTVLIALTFITGTYLVVAMHAPLLRTCMTGLVYLSVALTGVVIGARRLAKQEQENN